MIYLAMIDQMLLLHPSIPYLHMGCDEVYYRLVHPQCANLDFRDDADLFIRHVTRVAKYIKSKRPGIKLFIWHDMLSQLVNSGYSNVRKKLILKNMNRFVVFCLQIDYRISSACCTNGMDIC
jgi:hypothetical protein